MQNGRYEGDYPTVQVKIPRDIQYEKPKRITAKEVMNTSVIMFHPDTPVMDCVDTLIKRKITGAPVVNELNEIQGVISEKDVLKLIMHEGYTQAPTGTVSDYMSKMVESVGPEEEIHKIASLFFERSYRRLPVVENKQVLGIISRRDILQYIKELRG